MTADRTDADDYAEVIAAGVAEVEASTDEDALGHYLEDVLDIRYLVDEDVTVREVTLVVTYGGPYAEVRVWLGSDTAEVHAISGSDRATRWQYAPNLAANLEQLADAWALAVRR